MLRAEVTSPCYDAVHTRTVAFVDGDYWVVHDRLRARPRTSTRPAGTWRRSAAHGAVELGAGRVSAPGLLLLAPHGTLRLADGWVSPVVRGQGVGAGGRGRPPPARDVDLVTVLLPAVRRRRPARVTPTAPATR